MHEPRFRALAAIGASALIAVAGVAATTAPAQAAQWAPAGSARITPGVMMYTQGAQCTGNFVFKDKRGRVYVGYASHCAGTGTATDTDTDGCTSKSLPLGTAVRFTGDGNVGSDGTTVGRGRLVYSSWLTMQRLGTKAANTCAYNDFALVRVGPRFVTSVNPSVPFWGGPVALNTTGTKQGDQVCSYGNSSLRGGLTALSPKTGFSLGEGAGGWSRSVYTVSPGVPGDSGSGFMDAQGRALGILSTLALAPAPGSNGVGDLSHELAFARLHSGIRGLHLVKGTEPFNPVL